MNISTAWVALALEDPEPEQVLSRFEKALPGLGESRTFLLQRLSAAGTLR
jgi:hypothetical protein